MDEKRDRPNKSAASQASENTKKMPDDGKLSLFIAYLHSAQMLQLMTGVSQVILGGGVVAVSVLGLIQPLWLSTLFSIVASITMMLGIYGCYATLSAWSSRALLHDAMRRIVEAQN